MTQDPNADDLLPCPFCGNKEPYVYREGNSRQSHIVECGNCGCALESNNRNAWNRRALTAKPPAPSDSKISNSLGEPIGETYCNECGGSGMITVYSEAPGIVGEGKEPSGSLRDAAREEVREAADRLCKGFRAKCSEMTFRILVDDLEKAIQTARSAPKGTDLPVALGILDAWIALDDDGCHVWTTFCYPGNDHRGLHVHHVRSLAALHPQPRPMKLYAQSLHDAKWLPPDLKWLDVQAGGIKGFVQALQGPLADELAYRINSFEPQEPGACKHPTPSIELGPNGLSCKSCGKSLGEPRAEEKE